MRSAWLCLVCALASACVPWYRSDEDRALAADDRETLAAAIAECKQVRATSAGEAASCFERLLQLNAFEARASLGMAEALIADRRYTEARVIVERALEAVVSGKTVGGEDTKRELAKLFVSSYADDDLYGLALARARDLQTRAGESPPPLALAQASTEFPDVYRTLAEAQVRAAEGKPKEALERYATWLSSYGIADLPEVQAWADSVLESTLPLTDQLVAEGDEAMTNGAYVEALIRYSLAFRYRPSKRVRDEVADKLIQASSHIEAPDLLSPEARDLVTKADAQIDLGRVGTALHLYRRAIAIAPYWAEIRFNAAALFAVQGLHDLAADQLEWFLALDAGSERTARATELRDEWRKLGAATRSPEPPP